MAYQNNTVDGRVCSGIPPNHTHFSARECIELAEGSFTAAHANQKRRKAKPDVEQERYS